MIVLLACLTILAIGWLIQMVVQDPGFTLPLVVLLALAWFR